MSKYTEIRSNQTEKLYSRIVYSSIGYLISALIMVFYVASAPNSQAIWFWFSTISTVILYNVAISIAFYKQNTAGKSLKIWRYRFHAAAYITAITWGLSMWTYFPFGDVQDKFVVILILAGIAGGSLSSLSYDKTLVTIFLGIVLIGIESSLFWYSEIFDYALAVIVFIYFSFLIKAARDIGKSYEELLILKKDTENHNLTLLSTTEKMAQIGYWQWDTQSNLLELSPNLIAIGDFDNKHIKLNDFLDRVHKDEREQVKVSIDVISEKGGEDSIEFRLQGQNNNWLTVNQTIKRITQTSGQTFILGAVQDISLIKSVQQTMFDMAYTDDLTELANRGHFQQYLPEQIRHAIRNQRQLAIFYIDLNGFKIINDIVGHEKGNLFLSEFSRKLKNLFRNNDFIARIGGDEFCIIMNDITDGVDIAHVAKRCLDLELEPIKIDDQDFPPQFSIGIAIHPQDGLDSDSLIRAADSAMHKAKNSRNPHSYAFYDPLMTKDAKARLKLESDLKNAIQENQFKLVYQPKVSLIDGDLKGVEALIRWNHPERGMVFPDEFLATAEHIGLLDTIGDWVLKTACKQLHEWKQQGMNLDMAVNISPSHFNSDNFLQSVIDTKKQFFIEAGDLEIEITESISRDPEKHIQICTELRNHGIKVAIDDFGTGYSSLSLLSKLKIDTLKIDRAFIQHLPADKASFMLTATILKLAEGLSLNVVAEGVETREQAAILKEMGCTLAQGYYFSRAVEADKIPSLAKTTFLLTSDKTTNQSS